MKWGRALIIGVVIWLIIYSLKSLMSDWSLTGIFSMHFFLAWINGLLAYLFTRLVKPQKVRLAMTYGLSWVIVGLLCDWLFIYHKNADIFSSRFLWFGYLLMLILPIFNTDKSYKRPDVSSMLVG